MLEQGISECLCGSQNATDPQRCEHARKAVRLPSGVQRLRCSSSVIAHPFSLFTHEAKIAGLIFAVEQLLPFFPKATESIIN